MMNYNVDYHFGSGFALAIVLVVLWSLIWKGFALWRAARNAQTIWFWAMLIINTLGILEIIYLAFFSKKAAK